jgi:hypothetical protein
MGAAPLPRPATSRVTSSAGGPAARRFARPTHASPPSDSDAPSTSSVFPPYTLVSRTPAYDLRLYAPHWLISTPYTRRDEGFERLGSYGAGANAAGTVAPAAAQPVVMWFPSRPGGSGSGSGAAAEKRMTLHVLGAGAPGAGPPPAPTTPGVSLDVGGGEVLAVARFEGYATPDATLTALDALTSALAVDSLRLTPDAQAGAFRLAQYGALFTLETRVNEVQVGVVVG